MGYEVLPTTEPVLCPYCHVEARYVDSEVVYGKGNSLGMFYLCSNYPNCDARICAAGEFRPLGTLARFELRELRRTCRLHFDVLWYGKEASLTRDEAYAYLKTLMRLLYAKDAHFGMFDRERCRRFLERWNCSYCRRLADEGITFAPSHEGSRGCRNFAATGHGALAAGGTVTHCTCDGCF